jgi:hypothetical protein
VIKLCAICERILDEGDTVEVMIVTKYHNIPSTQHFALGSDIEALPETLAHHDCNFPKGLYDGD